MLYIVAILNISAALVAARRCGTWINPFTLAWIGFAAVAVMTDAQVLIPSDNEFGEITEGTANYLGIVSAGHLFVAFLLRSEKGKQISLVPRFEPMGLTMQVVMVVAICFVGTILLLARNNGVLPIFSMAQSYGAGLGVGYEEFHVPFVTALTLGAVRFAFVALTVDYVQKSQRFVEHLVIKAPLYAMSAVSAVMVLGAGLRNTIVWPVVIVALGTTRFYKVNWRKKVRLIGIGAVLAVLFIVIGNFRFGRTADARSPFEHLIFHEAPAKALDGVWSWFCVYGGTSFYNLNAILERPPVPQNGRIMLSEILPDALLPDYLTPPFNAVQYLAMENMMPYTGFTFRTFYADLVADFGEWGSIAVGLALWVMCALAHNMATKGVRWCVFYLCLLPAVLTTPFLGNFTGLPTLFGLMFGLLFIGEKKSKTRSSGRVLALLTGQNERANGGLGANPCQSNPDSLAL